MKSILWSYGIDIRHVWARFVCWLMWHDHSMTEYDWRGEPHYSEWHPYCRRCNKHWQETYP